MKGMPVFYQEDDVYYAEWNDKLYKCIDNEAWEKSQIFFHAPAVVDYEIWKKIEL